MTTQANRVEWLLRVEGLKKRFGELEVLTGADLNVPRGQLVVVLGRSGSGKSVFLKCLADVMEPDEGRVEFDGRVLTRSDGAGRAEFRRRCSFLFQSNALFDSLTVLENVALPLEQTTDLGVKEVEQRSREALRQLELEAHEGRYPGQLSGGMQKRVALARAIVTRPELVLFDEPTAGLDPLRRNAVFGMIARYQRQFGFTAVVVTHDVPEALAAADQVALLEGGKMAFQGDAMAFRQSTLPVVCGFRDSVGHLAEALDAIRSGENFQTEQS